MACCLRRWSSYFSPLSSCDARSGFCTIPPFSLVSGISLLQTALVHVMPDVVHPPHFGLPFARVSLTSIFTVCLTLFPSTKLSVRPYQRNLVCLAFKVMFYTLNSLLILPLLSLFLKVSHPYLPQHHLSVKPLTKLAKQCMQRKLTAMINQNLSIVSFTLDIASLVRQCQNRCRIKCCQVER